MREPELVSFEIEGAEVAVRVVGDRDKPALLLIHGFPSSSQSFREGEATAHLTFEGTRNQYVGGVPRDIAERVDPIVALRADG